MFAKKLLILLVVGTAITGCTEQSVVILDLGAYVDEPSARATYLASERALEQLGFLRQPVQIPNTSATLARNEDDRFVAAYFIDPKSPSGRPHGWYVQVLLTKRGKSVEVVLAQPGAEKPSEALVGRGAELAHDIGQLLPAIAIQVK